MKRQKIIFRADGNRDIGMGHISRCLALAELLSENFEVVFAACEPETSIVKEIRKICDHVISLPKPKNSDDFNNELNSYLSGDEIVVLDGYSFTTEYESLLKKNTFAVITIDDIPYRHYVADGVINFCGAIQPTDYSKEFYTQLYLGFDYLFLRKPFLRNYSLNKKKGNRLLLNMGGTDSGNETHKTLISILDSGFRGEIEIIIGQTYAFKSLIESMRESYPRINISQGLTASEMFTTMSKCSIAVLPPSTVALEFLSTGGILFLKQTAGNQDCLKKHLLQENSALDYSEFELFMNSYKAKRWAHLSITPRKPINDSSLTRIKKIILLLSKSNKIIFRKATTNDARLCFGWITDPEVRKYSYSKSEILWEDHVQWFDKKISDNSCHYYIAEIAGDPIGQIRFDLSREEEKTYIISYLIDKDWRGKGFGNVILIRGIQNLIASQPVQKIVGFVQNFNKASIKAFDRAGFKKKVASLEYPNSCKFELLF